MPTETAKGPSLELSEIRPLLSISHLGCLVLAILVLSAPAMAVTPLGSWGFEGSLNGWSSTGGSPSASTDQAHSGSYSAKLVDAGITIVMNTVVGHQYKFTGWVKITSLSGSDWGGFTLSVEDYNYGLLASTPYLTITGNGTLWFKVSVPFTATTTQSRLFAQKFSGSGLHVTAYVDDLLFFERSAVNDPPQISAISVTPTTITSLPQTQTFSVTADDDDGAIVHYLWDFGDGGRALDPTGSRRAALTGNYTATLKVTDDDGGSATQSVTWSASDSRYPGLTVDPVPAQVGSATLSLTGTASGSGLSIWISSDRGGLTQATGTTSWSATVTLQPGQNRLTVQASASGFMTAIDVLVKYAPSDALAVGAVTPSAASVERWSTEELTFNILNTAATYVQFPYNPNPVAGLAFLDGITVDGVFWKSDNPSVTYRRPGFLNQAYQRWQKSGEEWLYPTGSPVWTVRFAPPALGTWQYRIEVTEAKGTAQSAVGSFTATTPSANNHGPIMVCPTDTRYFQYADGTPYLGSGQNCSFTPELYSYDAVNQFNAMGSGANEQFFRWWIPGHIWSSAWQAWNSRLDNDYLGNVPNPHLTLDRAYGNGLAAMQLDMTNQIMFQGWGSGHAPLIPGRTYRISIRWRTENVTGPSNSSYPYGICVKLTGWPTVGQTLTIPATVAQEHGDTPWHVSQGSFTASGDIISNVSIIFENCTGGTAYVDEIDLNEVLSGGALGPQLFRDGKLNSIYAFDMRRSAGIDTILTEAQNRNMAFQLVISEKQEILLNEMAPDGMPDRVGGDYSNVNGAATQVLHEDYWRYLSARYGSYRSVHNWELCNEVAPSFGDSFRLTNDLATRAGADGNPHMGSISTWSSLAADAWLNPGSAAIQHTDFHAYARSTGWITPKNDLAIDSARFFNSYDLAAKAANFNKPVVWGEMGIDSTSGNTNEDPQSDQR